MSIKRLDDPIESDVSEIPAPLVGPPSTPTNNVLEISDFCVDYGTGDEMVRAINHVSLQLPRSTVLGIAGESGSGKSTLVYAMTRLLRAPGMISGGSVLLNSPGEDGGVASSLDLVTANESELRKIRWSHISIVLQSALSALDPVQRISKEFGEVLKTHRPDMRKAQRHALRGLHPLGDFTSRRAADALRMSQMRFSPARAALSSRASRWDCNSISSARRPALFLLSSEM